MEQFKRSSLILGEETIDNFSHPRILVIGLGGVGGYAVEGLARAGFSKFTIMDFDTVSESNINRQILALHSTIGKNKAEICKSRILDINPDAKVDVINDFIDQSNRTDILAKVDFVVDCIDSLGPKVALIEECYKSGKPIVSCMGSGNKLDPEKIRITDISKTFNCSLASKVRKYLRKRNIRKGIPCVFSEELPINDYLKAGKGSSDEVNHRGRTRTLVGSISYIPAIMGMFLASYVIRFYAKIIK